MGNAHTKKYFNKMASNGLVRVHPRIPSGASSYMLNIAGKMRNGTWGDEQRELTNEYIKQTSFGGDLIMVHPFIPSAFRDEFVAIAKMVRGNTVLSVK